MVFWISSQIIGINEIATTDCIKYKKTLYVIKILQI